jgi:putative FmdB family regulatory protein
MPIYEYTCALCNQDTEVLQKYSDAPATLCPHCKKEGLTRKISAPPFHLKGTGWYVTDFRDKDKPKKAEAKPAETTGKKDAAEKATETKAAEAPTPAPATTTTKKED